MRLLLGLLLAGLASAANTTTSGALTTPPPTVSGMVVVRVKINGVYVDFAGCNISSFGDVVCSSDIGHDVTVTPLESTGSPWWVWLVVAIAGLLGVILAAVALCGFDDSKRRPGPEYDEGYAGYGRVPTAGSTRTIGVAIERAWLPQVMA